MRSENKSLSNLFRAARNEAEPDLVKPDEIQRLLGNPVMPHVPLTSRIGQHLSKRLLSTPFRLGTTMMTTATLATIGGVALHSLLFGSVGQGVVKHNPLNTSSKVSATLSSNSQNNETTIVSPVSRIALHPTAQKTMLTEEPAIVKASKSDPALDSLKPIELSVDQLNRLGVVLSENGDIIVYEKAGDGITPYTFPANGSVRVQFGLEDHLTMSDVPGIQVLDRMPRLITESNGVKRFYTFERDTSVLKLINGIKDSIRLTELGIAQDEGENDSVDSERVVKAFGFIKNVEDSSMWSNKAGENLNVDSMLQSLNIDPSKIKGQVQIKINLETDGDSNSALNWSKNIKGGFNIDSILRSLGVDPAVKGNVQVHIGSADSGSIGMKLPKHGIHNFQNAMKSSLHFMEEFHHSLESLSPLMENFQRSMEAEIKLDSLIPIRVRNLNNAGHPNELIFWYEPTPEVTNLLPATVYTKVEAKPQHVTLSVYPNPTNGLAVVHYELKDAQQADFSIYNLLGQKLLDAGSTSGKTGDSKIDLSSLDAGMYLLITTTDNGDREIERIVLEK